MLHYLSSTLVASGGVTRTSRGTIQLPAKSKAIVGAWCDASGGLGATTLQNVSGIFEMESVDVGIAPFQVPISPVIVLANGGAPEIKVWPMNAGVGGGERINGFITMNNAQTIVPQCRFGLVVEVP